MSRMKAIRRAAVFFLCLLLTSCGAKNGKWLVLGFDLGTGLGMRPDPVETFAGCIRQQKEMTASEWYQVFQEEVAAIRKKGAYGNWGQLACLAFNESATGLEVKTALSLMPKEDLSTREELVLGIVEPLLEQRMKNLSRLKRMGKQLESNSGTIRELKEKVRKLQEIEGLLEKK